MPREFVQQNRYSIYRAAALEVGLNLLWRRAIVDIADKDASRIDVLLVLPKLVALLIQRSLHVAQFLGFGLHLLNALLHCRDFILQSISFVF